MGHWTLVKIINGNLIGVINRDLVKITDGPLIDPQAELSQRLGEARLPWSGVRPLVARGPKIHSVLTELVGSYSLQFGATP